MKKIILMNVFIIVFLVEPVMAHPPNKIELDYDQEEKVLYIDIYHLSRNHLKHFIRKFEIYKNGEKVKTETNRQQIQPLHLTFEVPLEAEIDDEIEVKAYSTKGGIKSAQLGIEVIDEEEAKEKAKKRVKKKKERYSDVYGSKTDPFGSKEKVVTSEAGLFKSKEEMFKDKMDVFTSKEDVYKSKEKAN